MALLNIIKEGDDLLRKKSRRVEEITPRIITLLDDMKATLAFSGGMGLAAPQVGVLRRIFIVDTGEEIIELINPEIIHAEGEQEGPEACLSIPGKWGLVKRPMDVTVKGRDRHGNIKTYKGNELVARCFCHEYDHLEGVLYPDIAEKMLDPEEIEQQ